MPNSSAVEKSIVMHVAGASAAAAVCNTVSLRVEQVHAISILSLSGLLLAVRFRVKSLLVK